MCIEYQCSFTMPTICFHFVVVVVNPSIGIIFQLVDQNIHKTIVGILESTILIRMKNRFNPSSNEC